jgi:indolepyruvate ferredoxin oxidoreductase, beta subunit
LSLLAMGKRWRRATLRFAREETAMLGWLERIRAAASGNYQLAVELVRCQKLVRGYGETHERGMANFTWIMAALETHPGLGAAKLRDLRKAAEADDKAEALGRALASLPD